MLIMYRTAMKCTRRPCPMAAILASAVVILAIVRYQSLRYAPTQDIRRRRYIEEFEIDDDDWQPPAQTTEWPASSGASCRMSNCFNSTPCRLYGFRIYVYPDGRRAVSENYAKVLRALRSSRYYTTDPTRACLFVLSVDTLHRDRQSHDYVPNIQAQIDALKWWRGGVNHVVFNLDSGTQPDYNDNDLGFNIGKAMLAKASMSQVHYRIGFDVSFPLFNKELKFHGGEPGAMTSGVLPLRKNFVLSFKGECSVNGVGSETCNSLHRIHNGKDIVLLTACEHERDKYREHVKHDPRCDKDDHEYDR